VGAATATTVDTTGTKPTEQLAKVAAAVQPSVVSITVRADSGSDEGSGMIYKSDGTILTNNHVIAPAAAGAGTISVKFANGKTATADLVGRDPTTDLALIKARGVSGLRPVTFAKSSDLHVGDTVLAIGSPLGLEGSVSAGIVSALHRAITTGDQSQSSSPSTVGDAIQTDAAVNPGNSGGPLVDVSGHVVGINSAIATLGGGGGGQAGSIGLGFAIPADEAQNVATQLTQGKTPQHALLGVQVSDAPQGGALIGSVSGNGPAAAAGLQASDVVTAVDGRSVDGADALTAMVRGHRPGDKVTVTYTRGGTSHRVGVTLGTAN
jgi:putative serine protease PepD